MIDGSTFKPKSLKNQSQTGKNSVKTMQAEEEGEHAVVIGAQAKNLKRALVNAGGNCHDQEEGQETVQQLFKVKLKPLRLKLNDPWAPRKARKSSKSEQ